MVMTIKIRVLNLNDESTTLSRWVPWWGNYVDTMRKNWNSTHNTVNFTSSTDYIIEQLNKKNIHAVGKKFGSTVIITDLLFESKEDMMQFILEWS